MGVKAPAPPQRKSSAPYVIAAICVFAIAFAGWWSGREPSENKPTPPEDERNVIITFEAVWGEMIDTGETYEDTGNPIVNFRSSEEVPDSILYWINGEEKEGDPLDSDSDESGIWRVHEAVPIGSTVTLRVQFPHWTMCVIKQDFGAVAIATSTGREACEVEHVVFGI